ncbi:MAG: hypothetical protein AAF202_12485, partial [Pseudomonadota bacterium]
MAVSGPEFGPGHTDFQTDSNGSASDAYEEHVTNNPTDFTNETTGVEEVDSANGNTSTTTTTSNTNSTNSSNDSDNDSGGGYHEEAFGDQIEENQVDRAIEQMTMDEIAIAIQTTQLTDGANNLGLSDNQEAAVMDNGITTPETIASVGRDEVMTGQPQSGSLKFYEDMEDKDASDNHDGSADEAVEATSPQNCPECYDENGKPTTKYFAVYNHYYYRSVAESYGLDPLALNGVGIPGEGDRLPLGPMDSLLQYQLQENVPGEGGADIAKDIDLYARLDAGVRAGHIDSYMPNQLNATNPDLA